MTTGSSKTLDLCKSLISLASVTPHDNGCQELLIERLEAIGFVVERLTFGNVQNFWARRGKDSPLLAFLGHTDVVPTGPVEDWVSPPFEPTIRDGYLYGRGAADMKGGLAAMLTACEDFVKANPNHKGSIGFLATSDEEGPSIDGTVKVVEWLESRNEKIDWCIVGEPTCVNKLGDTIKNGRRGSLSGKLTIHGVQGHVAYPQLAKNPIHFFAEPLKKLSAEVWDKGNEYFPATTFQFSNVRAGTGAGNVIPGHLEADFNLRYSTESTPEALKSRIQKILDDCLDNNLKDCNNVRYELKWLPPSLPFLTPKGDLVAAALKAIKQVTGVGSDLSTTGGTSDGRFIAPTGAQVLELGLVNSTIHKVNECTAVADLATLSNIYEMVLEALLGA